MSLEIIERDGIRYAELLRGDGRFAATQFFSPQDSSFQFGVLVQPAGYSEPAHYHLPVSEREQSMSELIVVQHGSMTISFYSAEGVCFRDVTLGSGDAIVLVDGVHSYRAVADVQALVLKQGPFQNGRDKVLVTAG